MPQIKSKSAAVNTPPAPSYHTLPSGRRQGWRMPDLLSIITFDGLTPDSVTAAVIKLLVNEGSYVTEEDPRSFHHGVERVRGVYGIVAAGCVDPPFDPHLTYGDGVTLGRADWPWADVEYCYHVLFRAGATGTSRSLTDTDDTDGTANPARAGSDVPGEDASRTDGD
jgi:hypothetical protein